MRFFIDKGHIRKRGKSWTIVYDEPIGEDGKRNQRWCGGFATKRQARRALGQVLESIERGDYVSPPKRKQTNARAVAPSDLPLTLTVEETASLLGVSRGSAYAAARTGQLPTLRIGRRLLVPTARLLNFLESDGGADIDELFDRAREQWAQDKV